MFLHSKNAVTYQSVCGSVFIKIYFMIIFTLELSVPAGSAPPKSFFHPVFRTPEE